jgi:predicted permease
VQSTGALFAWAWSTKRGDGLDWAITLFQASVMPNTIIIGIPVLSPLYSITGSGIAAIFIGQVLWLYPVLLIYEIRAVKELAKPAPSPASAPQAQAAAGARNVVTAPVTDHPHGTPGNSSINQHKCT